MNMGFRSIHRLAFVRILLCGVGLNADGAPLPQHGLGVKTGGNHTVEEHLRRMQEVPDYMVANYTLSNCEQADHCGTYVLRSLHSIWTAVFRMRG